MKARCARKSAVLLIVVAALVMVAPRGSVAVAQELPDAADVIDRHLEAIGGRDAIAAHTSSKATGSLELLGQGLYGTLAIYAAAPDKNLITINFPDVGMESHVGYDGNVGWSWDTMTGERLLQGGELQQLVDEADYYSDLHDPEQFESIETVEAVAFAGRETYKLRLVYKSGRETFEYFDIETGRMVGTEQVQESMMGSMNVSTVIEDYQQFDDVFAPTRIIQEVGPGQTLAVNIETIEFDTVDPTVFDLPAAIQALIR